jgi:hypothetical protein
MVSFSILLGFKAFGISIRLLFTLPQISTLTAVLLEIKPSRHGISGCS